MRRQPNVSIELNMFKLNLLWLGDMRKSLLNNSDDTIDTIDVSPPFGFAKGTEIQPPHDMIKLHSGALLRMHWQLTLDCAPAASQPPPEQPDP